MSQNAGETYVNLSIRSKDLESGIARAKMSLKTFERESLAIGKSIKMGFASLFGGVALGSAWNLAGKAAEFEEMKAGLQGLAGQYNITADAAVKMAKEAVDGQLSMSAAGELAARSLALGFNPTQMADFLGVAERMTDVVGGDIPSAFNAMEKAAATGRANSLIAYGIQVDFNKALEEYAADHAIAKDALDEHTKTQVRAQAILDAGKEKMDLMGESTLSTADKMNQLRAKIEDINLIIGQGLVRFALAAYGSLQWLASGALEAYGAFEKMREGWANVQKYMHPFSWDKWSKAAEQYGENSKMAFGAAEELAGKAAANIKAATAATSELSTAMKKVPQATGKSFPEPGAYPKPPKQSSAPKEKPVAYAPSDDYATAIYNANVAEEMAIEQMKVDVELGLQETTASIDAVEAKAAESFRGIAVNGSQMSEDLKNAVSGWGSHFASTLNEAAWGADVSFKSIATSFAKMITEMMIQKSLVEPLLGSLMGGGAGGGGGGLFGALGGLLGGIGSLFGFAEGGVINEPILGFGMSGRSYMFGEGGESEYIVPKSKVAEVGSSEGGGSSNNNFNITIMAADARSFTEMTMRNPEAIIGPFRKALRSGNRGLISDMRAVG